MKKIRVYELAKSKNLSSANVISLLKKKGLKKALPITWVDPTVLDDMAPQSSRTGTISHIFSLPASRAAAIAKKVRNLDILRESPPKKVPAAKAKKEKKESAKETKKGRKFPLDIAAAVAAVLAILLVGLTYMGMRADRAFLKNLSSGMNQLQGSVSKLEKSVTGNRTEIMKTREEVEILSGRMASAELAILTSQLKSQATVLRALSGNLREPLRSRTSNLADKLSAF